jgi:hypothetical protein
VILDIITVLSSPAQAGDPVIRGGAAELRCLGLLDARFRGHDEINGLPCA